MATRQYIGARYVPVFFNGEGGSTDWVSGIPYEALVIVTRYGSSYTSKKAVPNNIGEPEDNPEYWVLTANYNAQLEVYRQIAENTKETVDGLIEHLKPLSTFDGDNDTERFTNAIAAGGAIIDSDIALNNIDINRSNVTFWGMGHKINVNGIITGTESYTKNTNFVDCFFDGTNGGKFVLSESPATWYGVSFYRCRFENFTNIVLDGSCQEVKIHGCYFDYNSAECIKFSRIDHLVIDCCEVENHSAGFLRCTGQCQNIVVRDSVIEGLSGVAFQFDAGINIGVFSGLYLEDNNTNFYVVKDASQGARFENIYCVIGSNSANESLVRLVQGSNPNMVGTFTFDNNTVYEGRIVHIDSTNSVVSKLEFLNNYSSYGDTYNQASPKGGSVVGKIVKSKQFTITAAANRTDYDIRSDDIYQHKIVGGVCTLVVDTTAFNAADADYWRVRLDTDGYIILYGSSSTELRYNVTLFYL